MITFITTKIYPSNTKWNISRDLNGIISKLENEKEICLDTETTHLDPLLGSIIMLQFGISSGDQYVIDARDYDISILKPLLENKNITFVGHNIKFDYNMLKNYGIVLNKVYDTMIIDQVLNCGRYNSSNTKGRFSLKGVYKHYFKKDIEKEVRNEFQSLKDRHFTEKQILYGASDVVYPLEIKEKQENLIKLYDIENTKKLENEFVLVIGDMEYNGIKIDVNKLKVIIEKTKLSKQESIKDLDEYLISKNPRFKKDAVQLGLFGVNDTKLTNVNWSSDQQVYDILQKVFNITPVDKYGKESAGKDALEQLDETFYDPIIAKILKYRKEDKIISSFGEDYIRKYLKSDGKLHSNFNQIVSTGRISSRDPKKLGVYIVIYILNRLNCWKTEMLISSQDSEC